MKTLSNEKRIFITWSLIFLSQSIGTVIPFFSKFFLQNSDGRNFTSSLMLIITAIILYLNYPAFVRLIKEDYRLNPTKTNHTRTHSQKYLPFYMFVIAFLMVICPTYLYSDIAKTDNLPKILAICYFLILIFIGTSYRFLFKKEKSL